MDETLKKLGTVRPKDEGRDAIHIAVLTLKAGENNEDDLRPGMWVDAKGNPASPTTGVGIVDPFLPEGTLIREGEWFYVYLRPGSISGLSHVWEHDAFPPVVPKPSVDGGELKSKAEDRIRQFCESVGVTVVDFVDALINGRSTSLTNMGAYLLGDESMSGDIPEYILDDVEFVFGQKLSYRPTYFSCSC